MPPADPSKPRLPRGCYVLNMRQTPQVGKTVGSRLSERRPLDPPPILRLQVKDQNDPAQNYLQSPYYFCVCTLWDTEEDQPATYTGHLPPLAGALVSSLHKLKDITNEDGGFFVFGDLCVRPEGDFRLRFALFEMLDGEVVFLNACLSEPFRVHTTKTFPGLPESTYLSRAFADQGVRLRIRKEGRIAPKRYARSQNVSEDDGYSSKPTTNPSPVLQHPVYSETSAYSQNRLDFDQRSIKRPRMTAEASIPSLTDSWSYTSSTPSTGLYSPMYSQNFPQNIPQTFTHNSQPYVPSTSSLQNMIPFPRMAQPTQWATQPRHDPLSLSYRYYADDPVRQI